MREYHGLTFVVENGSLTSPLSLHSVDMYGILGAIGVALIDGFAGALA